MCERNQEMCERNQETAEGIFRGNLHLLSCSEGFELLYVFQDQDKLDIQHCSVKDECRRE